MVESTNIKFSFFESTSRIMMIHQIVVVRDAIKGFKLLRWNDGYIIT
jgi:hypothetical protein